MRMRTGLLLAALSGGLFGGSFVPFPPWAAFFALVPIFYVTLKETCWPKVILYILIFNFVSSLITVNWLTHTFVNYAELPFWLAGLAFAFLALFEPIFYLLSFGVFFFLRRHLSSLSTTQQIFFLTSLSYLFFCFIPSLFPFQFSVSFLYHNIPFYKWAPFIGFEGLDALIWVSNGVLLWGIWNRKKILSSALVLGGALFFTVSGHFIYPEFKPNANLKVQLVESGIDFVGNLYRKFGNSAQSVNLQIYTSMSQIKGNPDLVVWPEASLPFDFHGRGDLRNTVVQFIKKEKINLIAGGSYFSEGRPTNSMFFFDEKGVFSDSPYNKHLLLVGGETVPWAQTFPALGQLIASYAGMTTLQPGVGPLVKKISHFKVGPQICYEGLFPWFSRALSWQGAQFFVNISNDSWYGSKQEKLQHLWLTIARSIEFQRPLVRVTRTGLTGVYSLNGSWQELPHKGSEIFDLSYVKNPKQTFYSHYPRLIQLLIFLGLTFILMRTFVFQVRKDNVRTEK